MDIEIIESKVNKSKTKKKKSKSIYREEKEYPHTTIGGKGHVARIKKSK
jgi:hypothetical protein